MPSYAARRLLSYEFASHWGVMPVSYDADKDRLVIAVHDLVQVGRVRSVWRLLMQPHRLDFCVASEEEIAQSFKKHFGGPEKGPKRWMLRPLVSEEAAAGRLSSSAMGRRSAAAMAVASSPRREAWSLSRGLTSVVALLVSRELAGEATLLDETRARVRYCQLLASRMNVSSRQMDGLILAAWLSPLADKTSLLAQLDTPFPLTEILKQAAPAGQPTCAEARILGLVTTYQEIRRGNPVLCRDLSSIRRHLRQRWGAAMREEGMLETFLQILVDEDFVTELHSETGKILVVDPAETVDAMLTPPLVDDGFRVEVVGGMRAALDRLEHEPANLVITAVRLADGDGLWLCRHLRAREGWREIPVFVLSDKVDEGLEVEALKAGAEDLLARTSSMEVLRLKVQHTLAAVRSEREERGVQGTLRDMSFTDLVQVVAAGGKKMSISVSGDVGEGFVYLDGDKVVHAEMGDCEGEEAFYALMTWQDGEFTACREETFERTTMRMPIMSLLMEGAKRCDEGE